MYLLNKWVEFILYIFGPQIEMTINQIGSCKRFESIFEAGFFRSLYLIFQLSLNSKHYLFTDSRRIFLNNLKKKQAVTWDHSLCCFCLKSPNSVKTFIFPIFLNEFSEQKILHSPTANSIGNLKEPPNRYKESLQYQKVHIFISGIEVSRATGNSQGRML